jgi:hypothetical protein
MAGNGTSGERSGAVMHTAERLAQFEVCYAGEVTAMRLELECPHCKVVALAGPEDLKALEVCLLETDPDATDMVVLAAHPPAAAGAYGNAEQTDVVLAGACITDGPESPVGDRDRPLMTRVVNRSEVAGKPVKPAVILTADPPSAVLAAVRSNYCFSTTGQKVSKSSSSIGAGSGAPAQTADITP